ncbi:uncharacterized protein N7479_010485 [Penicillium vulpinum]|uniref:uncharacterized protein n=1 Tax=Penicillium vulpinum TaxID=29845 RepID=UPI0025485108|nr:uncharacterized protein N7479_010485 [Penicillium vulpinum]KAJ5952072.1 hypothetical protein N7479_010485 [Penicillium vulpinum]
MTESYNEQKCVIIRLRSKEFDNGKPDVIIEIFHAFLEFFGYRNNDVLQDKHFVHYELPQIPPRRHFYVVLDMNYKKGIPDLDYIQFEVYKASCKLLIDMSQYL